MSKYIRQLQNQLQQLQDLLSKGEMLNTSVSSSPVIWHIDHSLKVINVISMALNQSDPKDYRRSFNFKRLYVRIMGDFPRGAKAPKPVRPPEVITIQNVEEQLKIAEQNIREFGSLPVRANFSHHVLGLLNRDSTIWFMGVHTHHHLKIIKEILAKEK